MKKQKHNRIYNGICTFSPTYKENQKYSSVRYIFCSHSCFQELKLGTSQIESKNFWYGILKVVHGAILYKIVQKSLWPVFTPDPVILTTALIKILLMIINKNFLATLRLKHMTPCPISDWRKDSLCYQLIYWVMPSLWKCWIKSNAGTYT